MNIGIFETLPGFGGGNIYQKNIIKALRSKHKISCFELSRHKLLGNRIGKIKQAAEIVRNHREIDVWITTYLPTIALAFARPRGNAISLFYHHDDHMYPNRILSLFMKKVYFNQVRQCGKVVTIAKYWKEYLNSHGVIDQTIIYWGFDSSLFDYSPEVAQEFRYKYHFPGKPIIYLGNCQRHKGVIQSYDALKDMDAYLITSGEKEVKIPALNLNLTYNDYRKLIYTSNVALTMSQFKEGWNATAHESMLARTPVIGSGLGGMAELLEGGGQIICENISDLPDHVSNVLSNSRNYGDRGYDFASQFTLDRFGSDWNELVSQFQGTN